MKFDLHCHSNASDGKLGPEEVLKLAAAAELDLFALTDHDTIQGYESVKDKTLPYHLISGIAIIKLFDNMSFF